MIVLLFLNRTMIVFTMILFMEKILISACLVGDNVKYNGGNNLSPKIDALLEKYELIPFCPEVESGLPTPRASSEIKDGRVINTEGEDVTDAFVRGAELAFNICLYLKIKKVILKEKSPSCGSKIIYDGSFSHKEIPGMGITAQYLKEKGIEVYSEDDIDSLL